MTKPEPMLVSDLDYHLPTRLIAQYPAPRRDSSRLLVLDRHSGRLIDSTFDKIGEFIEQGTLLAVNNTRVFPARLIGRRADGTGAGRRVEVLLVRAMANGLWEALVKPARSLTPGAQVDFGDGALKAQIVERTGPGSRIVEFSPSGDLDSLIDAIGTTPLPPYIKRETRDSLDSERYQTVFASKRGAIAAPTAGLHFTFELFEHLRQKGVERVEITHHVGYGTFQPVRVERVEDHRVEEESYEIDPIAAARMNSAIDQARKIVAVGTTTTRALESSVSGNPPRIAPGSRTTGLFIYPEFEFRVIGGLITNFHLPRSSLLMLVSAFAGRDQVLKAYRHAVAREYRFYSFGDAMLIM